MVLTRIFHDNPAVACESLMDSASVSHQTAQRLATNYHEIFGLKFFLVLIFICLSSYRLAAQEACTVQEYAFFLNKVATTDEQHLYDLKMEENHQSGSIVRSGVPGGYSYHAREEAAPVLYANANTAKQYAFWENSLEDGNRESHLMFYEQDDLSKEEQGASDALLKMNRSCVFGDLPSKNFAQACSKLTQEEKGTVTLVAMLSTLFATPLVCQRSQRQQHTEATLSQHDQERVLKREQSSSGHVDDSLSVNGSLESQNREKETAKKDALLHVYRPFSHGFLASSQVGTFAKKLKDTDVSKENDDLFQRGFRADLSKLSFFEKMKRYWYAQRCHLKATINWVPSLEYRWAPEAKEKKIIVKLNGIVRTEERLWPLPQYHGLIGLNNLSGCCALNAALQTMKVILQIVLEHKASEQERQQFKEMIQEKMPHLCKFLENKTFLGLDGLLLQRETLRKMVEGFWYSYVSENGIALQSWLSGYACDIDPRAVIWVLLHELQLPSIYSKQVFSRLGTQMSDTFHYSSEILYCRSTKNNSSSISSMQELVTEALKQEGRVIEEPTPPMLVVIKDKNNSAKQLLAPLTFNLTNGSHITYQPRLVICVTYFEEKGHAFVILKKEDRWYEVNDEKIFSLLPAWENDLEEYCSGVGRVVVYEKKREGDASLERQVEETRPLEELPIYNQMQHIVQELKQVGEWNPVNFLNDPFALVNSSVSQDEFSFFLQQAAHFLSNVETLR